MRELLRMKQSKRTKKHSKGVWTPVTEGLPPQEVDNCSDDCLIAIRYAYDLDSDKPTITAGYLLCGEWWSYMAHDCHKVDNGDIVTHWMLQPEPPEIGAKK